MLCAGEALLGWSRHHTSNIRDQAKGHRIGENPEKRVWDVGREVGANGETKIAVVVDDAGTVHGWPSGR